MRVAFATNDERTAKRISDALGTATEMRAMKNYAGHRLSPWLGHLMVSRTETARALLTPGEIMQLPAEDEIVMAAGVAPIRAKKARYFTDRRFAARIMPPPPPWRADGGSRPADDWTSVSPGGETSGLEGEANAAPDLAGQTPAQVREVAGPGGFVKGAAEGAADQGPSGDGVGSTSPSEQADGGIRREPELGEHEEVVPQVRHRQNEFDFGEDDTDPDVEAARARIAADRSLASNARRARLDPADGLEL